MTCCPSVPEYAVSSVAVDTATGIATITVDATSINPGRFNLRFRTCCQRLSPCFGETVQLVAGTTTYANVLARSGEFIKLGQLARQVNCCGIVHCNLTTTPAGNVMVLDKVPLCAPASTVGIAPTIITIDS